MATRMRKGAGVNIATSRSVKKQLFSVQRRKLSSEAVLPLKPAHLKNWLPGLSFSADQLLVSPISC